MRVQEVATKAKSTWDKFRKERDFHKMHHKRVVQARGHTFSSSPLISPLISPFRLTSPPSLSQFPSHGHAWLPCLARRRKTSSSSI